MSAQPLNSTRRTVSELNAARREAVSLRLAGATIAEARAKTALSAPTIIAALKAYRHGGWDAVDVKPRGRPRADRLAGSDTRPSGNRTSGATGARPSGGRASSATGTSTSGNRAGGAAGDSEPTDQAAPRQRDTSVNLRNRALLAMLSPPPLPDGKAGGPSAPLWCNDATTAWLAANLVRAVSHSTVRNWLGQWQLLPASRYRTIRSAARRDESVDTPSAGTALKPVSPADDALAALLAQHESFARRQRRLKRPLFWVDARRLPPTGGEQPFWQLFAHDLRGHPRWLLTRSRPGVTDYLRFWEALRQASGGPLALVLPQQSLAHIPALANWLAQSATEYLIVDAANHAAPRGNRQHADPSITTSTNTTTATEPMSKQSAVVARDTAPSEAAPENAPAPATRTLTHLQRLEAESIQIMREVVAEAENPVMLYSIGKDSAVMLHLARKAFYPAPPPFPLLHVDTQWKFRAMYEFREKIVRDYGLELIQYVNPEGVEKGVNPFTHGSSLHTDIMKTQGLKQALDKYGFDFAFGGARRDEEKSRAKERVLSFRNAQHRWDAKNQRPELWQLYNTRKRKGESIRAFPLSNWTELDIWQYIHKEEIPIVPLYYAAERPIVWRDGTMIMVDDERMPLREGEVPEMRKVRFRTLGCYPLTGAVDSNAATLEDIIQEMLLTRTSERQGRMIDHDEAGSMEKKKAEGYF